MATRGGFAAWTERAKDVIVDELRSYLSLNYANVLKEMPQIERYGLAGQTTAESFVSIFTALPHDEQHIPFIAVMSSPGVERKMGIGRQVIKTFHDPTTGLPMIREMVGGELNVIIEIVSVDTNQRSELTDIIFSFFTMYAEQTSFSFLGDTTPDVNGVPRLYQLILQSKTTLGGETDQPRPEGEPFDRLYYNRITVPVVFLDYVDREAFDISACFDPTLTPLDDSTRERPIPLPEQDGMLTASFDDFEDASAPGALWNVFTNADASVTRITDSRVIKGLASVALEATAAGGLASLVNHHAATASGRLRVRFNDTDGGFALVLFAMLQGIDPRIDPCYHLIVKTGAPSRLEVRKGIIGDPAAVVVGRGSRVYIDTATNLAAQFEWQIDIPQNRIRLRGYVSKCQSDSFDELVKRLEVFDTTTPFMVSTGEGFGFVRGPVTATTGVVVVDDATILDEVQVIEESNPAHIGP